MFIKNISGLTILFENGLSLLPSKIVQLDMSFNKIELVDLLQQRKIVIQKFGHDSVCYVAEDVVKALTPMTAKSGSILEVESVEMSTTDLTTVMHANLLSLTSFLSIDRINTGCFEKEFYDIQHDFYSFTTFCSDIISTNIGLSLSYSCKRERLVVMNKEWVVYGDSHLSLIDGVYETRKPTSSLCLSRSFLRKNWSKYKYFEIDMIAPVDMFLAVRVNGVLFQKQFVKKGQSSVFLSTANMVLAKVKDFSLIFTSKDVLDDVVINNFFGCWDLDYVEQGSFTTLPYEQLFLNEIYFDATVQGDVSVELSFDGGISWRLMLRQEFRKWLKIQELGLTNKNKLMFRFILRNQDKLLPLVKDFNFSCRA